MLTQEFLQAVDDLSLDWVALYDHALQRMLGMPSHEVLEQSQAACAHR